MAVTAEASKEHFQLEFLSILNRAIQVPWHDVMRSLNERFPHTRFLVAQANLKANGEIYGWDGWDSSALGRRSETANQLGVPAIYEDSLAASDPLLKARAAGPGVFRVETLGTPDELISEVQRRILQPNGLVHGLILYLGTDRLIDGMVQCWRTAAGGAWTLEEIEEFKRLIDPLCDAIARDRDHRAALNEQMTTLLDALEGGAICVDSSGQLLHSNPRTPAVVRTPGGGGDDGTSLPEELQHSVVGFLGAQVKDRMRQLEVQLAADRINCVIHRISGFRAHHSAALVLFPEAPQQSRIAKLRKQYGLTPREGDVLIAVIRGNRNAEIAKALNLSEYTVKGHLKRIFQKLGVRSRSGAVAKVMGLETIMDEVGA